MTPEPEKPKAKARGKKRGRSASGAPAAWLPAMQPGQPARQAASQAASELCTQLPLQVSQLCSLHRQSAGAAAADQMPRCLISVFTADAVTAVQMGLSLASQAPRL